MPQESSLKLHKNPLEWIVFAISVVIVLGVLGYLAHAALTIGNAPPDIKITLGKAESAGGHFRVPVKILNNGDQTAAGVQIEIVLNEGQPSEEIANFETPFLPRHSQREGEVTFKTDPRAGELKARVLGYEKP